MLKIKVYEKTKIKSFLTNFLTIVIIVAVSFGFIEYSLSIPVMEINIEGKCFRVVDKKGGSIPDGCKAVEEGKIAVYSRHVRG